MQTSEPAVQRTSPGPALAWILYDIGYTVFAFAVFIRFLSPWIVNDLGTPDWYFSAGQAVTALGLVVMMPVAGAVADRMGRHVPLLAAFTCISAGAMAVLGTVPDTTHVGIIIALAVVGAFFVAMAFAQYDPLLARVAHERHWGRVSGLAVGMAVAGLAIALFPLTDLAAEQGKQATFIPAAIVYVALALPAILLIRERGRQPAAGDAPGELVTDERLRPLRHLVATVRGLRAYPDAVRLLVARFLYTDAIATSMVYLPVYIGYTEAFSEDEITATTAIAIAAAGVGAAGAGALSGRIGPRRVLALVLPAYAAGLALAGVTGSTWAIWIMAPIAGVGLGTVWTADRVLLLNLVPAERRGEFFALFNLVGRAAAGIAPLVLWGAVQQLLADGTGWVSELTAARTSLVLLATTPLLGWLVLRRIHDPTEPVLSRSARQRAAR